MILFVRQYNKYYPVTEVVHVTNDNKRRCLSYFGDRLPKTVEDFLSVANSVVTTTDSLHGEETVYSVDGLM